jgi:hypothetical protein
MKKTFVLIALAVIGMTAVTPRVQAQDVKKLEQLQQELEAIERRVEARGGQATAQEQQRVREIHQEIIQAAGPYGGMLPQNPSGQTPANRAEHERNVQGQEAQQREYQRQMEQMQSQQNAMQDYFLQQQRQEREAEERRQREEEEKRIRPGDNAGWPAASLYQSRFGLGAFRQPAGTVASYSINIQNRGEGDNIVFYLTSANEAAFRNIKEQVEAAVKKSLVMDQGTPGDWYIGVTDPLDPREQRFYIQVWLSRRDGTLTLSIASRGTKG